MRIPVLSYEPSRARIPLWDWIVGEHGADGYVSLWNARSRASAPCVGDEERDSRNELLHWKVVIARLVSFCGTSISSELQSSTGLHFYPIWEAASV